MAFRLKADNCITGSAYYTIANDHPQYKVWSAILIAAAHTSKPVVVRIDACDGSATNKPVVYIYQDF